MPNTTDGNTKTAKPRDLGNDQMFVRSEDNILTVAGTRVPLDLTLAGERKIARRFAERILAMCDYWENRL